MTKVTKKNIYSFKLNRKISLTKKRYGGGIRDISKNNVKDGGGERIKSAFSVEEISKEERDVLSKEKQLRKELKKEAEFREDIERKKRSEKNKERDEKIKDIKRKEKEMDKKIKDAKTPETKQQAEQMKKKELEIQRKKLDDEDLLRIKKYDCTSKSHYMEGMKESRKVKRRIKKYFRNAKPASTSGSMIDLVKELVKINMRFEKCRGRDINDEKPFYVGQDGKVKVPRAKRMAYKSLALACKEYKKARKELGSGIVKIGLPIEPEMKKNLDSTCDYVRPICGGLGQACKCIFGALMSKGHDTFCNGCVPISDVADEGEMRDKSKDELYAEMMKASQNSQKFKDKMDGKEAVKKTTNDTTKETGKESNKKKTVNA